MVTFSDTVSVHINKPIYTVKNLSISLPNKNKCYKKAKSYSAFIHNRKTVILKYNNNLLMEGDLRLMGLADKNFMENKIIVTNLSYKESKESIEEYFNKFGEVVKVILETNKKGLCTGKATVTINGYSFDKVEHKLINRVLKIERIKK